MHGAPWESATASVSATSVRENPSSFAFRMKTSRSTSFSSVQAIAGVGPLRLRQEPQQLVIADGLGGLPSSRQSDLDPGRSRPVAAPRSRSPVRC